VFSYFAGDSLKKALRDDCFASLEIDGQRLNERQTNWGSGLTPAALLSFLGSYRNKPASTKPLQNIREGLHHFLSAQRFFDIQLGAALARDVSTRQRSEIFIRGDASSLPLLINIPWELAEGVTIAAGRASLQTPLIGTLASLLLARVVSSSTTQFNPTPERLRVLYCISEPPDDTPIQAADFHQAIEATLKERPRLRYKSVLGGDFTPRFNELKAGIEEFRPNVLIVACHGQTLEGVPQLRFEEWHRVSSLADALTEHANTFLVLLIACDQTYLEEHPAAHSGAVTLIEKGILSVVAMQSSVSAILAKEFLGTTLDMFFETGAIALSVAEGRKSMAPTPADANAFTDWSFPALFLTEDAPQQMDKLATLIEGYIPTLEALLFRIPPPDIYFQRPQVDQPLHDFFEPGAVGLREVTGGLYAGKTTAVRYAARRALQEAIAMSDTSIRPILYVDFGRYKEMLRTAQGLMEILRKQTEEIQASVAGMPLLEWTTPRGADGEGRPGDSIQQLLRFIDMNKMVLIFDNLQEGDETFWPEFCTQAKALNHSLVIRVGETAVTTGADGLQVLPLSREETIKYVESFAPQQSAQADSWYEKTAGLLGMLDLLRRSGDWSDEVTVMASSEFTRNLSQAEQEILYTLVHLPNGVDSELASAYVTTHWFNLLKLAQRGLLLRESRFNLTSPWFRLPQILMHSLQGDQEKVTEAARSLADRFIEWIRERINSEEAESIEEIFISLAKKPGGIDFLQDIHQVFLSSEYSAQAHSLPLKLHDWLFSNGRWYEAYKLWERLLTESSFEETKAHEWIKLARAAHVLGLGNNAREFIEQAKKRGLTTLDEIDIQILSAALIKDSGDTSRKEEVTALYEEILRLIEVARESLSDEKKADFGLSDLERRRSVTIYNRALHRRFWLQDLPGALSDLDQAATEFGQLGQERMKALADCEWVDIQLDWRGHEKNWDEMLERLVKANVVFASGDDSPGDRAFCYYQMARYYRRKPFATEDKARENLVKARDAYRKSSEQAGLVGDVRQREIAEGHIVEVSWRDLSEMQDAEATARLDKVIGFLKSFTGDAWSMRVLRDMLSLRSHTLRNLHSEAVLPALREAWNAARQPPLHPEYSTDARRAARILFEYLEELEKAKQQLEADEVSVIAREVIERWLGHDIDPMKRRNWLGEVEKFGHGAGEYYGQPKK
jgi:hypothetical protein